MAENVTGGKRRKDEVGRSGIYPGSGPYPDDAEVVTPGEINKGRHREGPGVERNKDFKESSQQPPRGNEDEQPDNDALGG